MTNNDPWYERAEASVRLTQGDIIFGCPLISWADKPFSLSGGKFGEVLKTVTDTVVEDVVVMTQACDLENDKVSRVVLCPHWSLEHYKKEWEANARTNQQSPTPKAWNKHCDNIKDGYQWNLAILNEGTVLGLTIARRIVEFQDLYTVPRIFLETLIRERAEPRLRLKPPYREHLSQAFARFFMLVGLPVSVNSNW